MVKVREDLSGRQFERLKVLYQSRNDHITSKGKHCPKYWVQCDCGSEPFEAVSYQLKNGHKKSCGCLVVENGRKMGLGRRKHSSCKICGADEHYAKGLCKSCYRKSRRLKDVGKDLANTENERRNIC